MNITEVKNPALLKVQDLQFDKLYRLVDPPITHNKNKTYYIIIRDSNCKDKVLISLYDNNMYKFSDTDPDYLYEEVTHELIIKN